MKHSDGAASLIMYSKFFGLDSNIIGVGIEQRLEILPENVHVYTWGSHTEAKFVKFYLCKKMIDIIIDGSGKDHFLKFKIMWPCLGKNGLYIIEVIFPIFYFILSLIIVFGD